MKRTGILATALVLLTALSPAVQAQQTFIEEDISINNIDGIPSSDFFAFTQFIEPAATQLAMAGGEVVTYSGSPMIAAPGAMGPMGSSFSRPSHGRHRGGKDECSPSALCCPLMGDITLSDAQMEEFHKTRAQLMEQIIPLKAQLKVSRMKLKDLMLAKDVDQAAVQKIMADMNRQRDEMSNAFIDHLLRIRNIFTAEQREKIRNAMYRKEMGPLGAMPAPSPAMPAK